MATTGKVPKIKVSLSYHELETPGLNSFAEGTKFTGSLAPTPPQSDTTIYGYANTMITTHNSRQTAPSKTATSNEKTQRNILLTALDKNAAYLEGVANDAAIAAGDVAAGIAIVMAVGFKVASKKGGSHHYGVVNTGPGWVEAHEERTIQSTEGHIWEYGIAANKTTPPTSTNLRFTLTSQVIFENIASGSVFAYREASIVPTGKKAKAGTGTGTIPAPSTARKATKLATGKGNHPIIDTTNASPYTFTDWRYVIVP